MSNYDDVMDGTPAAPLFDIGDTNCSDFINPAPPRQYLTKGIAEIPKGIVALCSGPGGSSKSMLALGVALAIASGEPYLGFNPVGRNRVLILSGEDDKDEIHRRAVRMFPAIFPDSGGADFSTQDALDALELLFVPDLTGQNLKLSEKIEDIQETKVFESLMLALKPLGDIGFIIIDTGSRFRGGNENAAEDAAFFISLCERIAKETGATVLVITHSNKSGGGHQQSVRGSSALIDNARFVITLELDKDDSTLINVRVVKNNYGASGNKATFRRLEGGVLELQDPATTRTRKALAPLAGNGQEIVERVRDDRAAGTLMSAREFSREYGGIDNDFNMSQKRLYEAVAALISVGRLKTEQSGRKEVLVPAIEEVSP
jgi:hypothetical protein